MYFLRVLFYTLFTLCFVFSSLNTNAIEDNKIEAVFLKKTASIFLFQNDSLLKNGFEEARKNYKLEKFAIALGKSLKLYDTAVKKQEPYWLYKFSVLIGDIYAHNNRHLESINYRIKTLRFIDSNSEDKESLNVNQIELITTYSKLGNAYLRAYLAKHDSIRSKYNVYKDSSKYYYQLAEKLPTINKEIEVVKARVYSSLSGIYEIDSNYDKAEYYSLMAIDIDKKYKNSRSIAISLNSLGNLYLKQNKFLESKDIYQKAIDLIKYNDNSNIYRVKAGLYANLAWAMRNLEEFEAYDNLEESYRFQDTLRAKEYRVKLEEVKYKYDFDAQEELFKEQEKNRRLQSQRVFWIVGIIALVVIFTLLYWLNVKSNKLEKSEYRKNEELSKLKSESQTRIINATLDGKETERKQIAETLHDSVSALLSSANLHLQATRKQFNGSTPIEIDKTQKIILEASHQIRDLSHNLVSSTLLKFGLKMAIRDICEKYSNSELSISFKINNINRFHQDFEIKVYNIIQEFINNILKHSGAKNALIKIRAQNNQLFITIIDDGIGFDKTKIDGKDGLGINQIDARIKVMKGSFFINSSEGNGTQIHITIPVVEKEKITLVSPVL